MTKIKRVGKSNTTFTYFTVNISYNKMHSNHCDLRELKNKNKNPELIFQKYIHQFICITCFFLD